MNTLVSKPPATWIGSENYGVPKGSCCRGTYYPRAIMLHCGMTLVEQDGMACKEMTFKGIKQAHASLHYVVGNAGIHEYVKPDDIAWAISDTVGRPIDYNRFASWPPFQAYPNVPPYFYTVDIGIEQAQNILDCKKCDKPVALADARYTYLVRLIKWLAQKYNIPINKNWINFHQNLDAFGEGECVCYDIDQLIQDVLDYEDPCDNAMPPAEEGLVYSVLGGSPDCCLVKESFTSFTKRGLIALASDITNHGVAGTLPVRFLGDDGKWYLVSDLIAAANI